MHAPSGGCDDEECRNKLFKQMQAQSAGAARLAWIRLPRERKRAGASQPHLKSACQTAYARQPGG
jgi:hypothetical protein